MDYPECEVVAREQLYPTAKPTQNHSFILSLFETLRNSSL